MLFFWVRVVWAFAFFVLLCDSEKVKQRWPPALTEKIKALNKMRKLFRSRTNQCANCWLYIYNYAFYKGSKWTDRQLSIQENSENISTYLGMLRNSHRDQVYVGVRSFNVLKMCIYIYIYMYNILFCPAVIKSIDIFTSCAVWSNNGHFFDIIVLHELHHSNLPF